MATTMSSIAGTRLAAAQATNRPRTVRRVISCSAQPQEAGKQVGTAAAAAALAAVLSFGQVQPALADISGLTPCAESKAFAKVKKQQLKNLQKRLKLYEADSAPALALQATIEKTERRFDNYAKQGLLCGTDGLPHLISDPGFALKYGHAGDVFIPTFLFLYFAGWIGHSGRKYLIAIRDEAKPVDKEIIIDYPLALRCVRDGLGWPIDVVAELRNGTLLADDKEITVSPR